MSARLGCPCGAKLKAPVGKVGSQVGCPKCLDKVTVPEAPAPTEVDLAELDDEPAPAPVPSRRPPRPRREVEDDGVPIRSYSRRPNDDLGPRLIRRLIIGTVVSLFLSLPLGLMVSQLAPVFGTGWEELDQPFGPLRRRLIPVHLLWFGLTGVLLTAAGTVAVTFLSHSDRRH